MKFDKKVGMLEILFCLYLLALPLMNLPRYFPLGAKIQYSDIVFIFLFIFWLIRIAGVKNILLPSKKIIIALFLLIATNLFSCFNSVNFSKSLIDYLGLLYLIALFIVLFSLLQEKKIFYNAIHIIFLTSVITSIIGIVSFIFYFSGNALWVEKFLLFTPLKASVVPFPRIKSTFLLPEMFITFSQLGLVCGIISLELQNNIKIKRLFFLGVLIIITAVIFSYSRSLAGFFLTLSLIVLFKKDIRFSILVRTSVILMFVILLSGAIIASKWIIYPVTLSRDTNAQLMTVTFHTSPDIRALLRKAAFNIGLEHPFFGIGQGMFTYELKNYIDLNAAKHTIKINNFQSFEMDPHCAYFGSIAETGFIGLSFMLMLVYFIIQGSAKLIRQSSQSKYKNVKLYLFASFLGYLLTAWFMDTFSLRQFWINIALLISANRIVELKND